ncbi:uncharacterized protein EDB93DRAFT_1091910 [Suillus bovinus]|uniref:uncharacterized protein n=1 Tax=Suillus bovinus TaxID=48563 RepID=UPI001B870F0A|nr:uncharacterized protein EDB93DRAFT_1091910 [Suillus bovinus]KAG2136075.1 hypothetical protein EDB93DRAFT_1091910 [Suillus bovinus]
MEDGEQFNYNICDSLNHQLHCIGKIDFPHCLFCPEKDETMHHYLLNCPQYTRERHILNNTLRRQASSIAFLLASKKAIDPLRRFINSTGRFKMTFGEIPLTK